MLNPEQKMNLSHHGVLQSCVSSPLRLCYTSKSASKRENNLLIAINKVKQFIIIASGKIFK